MRGVLVLLLASFVGIGALGEGGSLAGGLGLEADFFYDGVAWDIGSAVTLSLSFGEIGVQSRTDFSLTGFESEKLDFTFSLEHIFHIRNSLVFDPCFSLYELEIGGSIFEDICCPGGFDWRMIFAYGNLEEPCQTPDYTIGFVFDTGLTWYLDECCMYFELRNFLSFGMGGLYSLVDDYPWTWVYPVPGVFFEEDLVKVAFVTPVFSAESLVFFDVSGFQWVQFGGLFTFEFFTLGGRAFFVAPFSFSTGDFILGLDIDGFSFRSYSTFDLLGFLAEEVRFEVEGDSLKGFLWIYFDIFGVIDVTTGLEVRW
jgi:hypothetical protein